MTFDLEAIERTAREWDDIDADWYPNVGPRTTLALIDCIRELEGELAATRRRADAASIDLHHARLAHQDELGAAAATEVRLTERVAELEELVEQLRCGDLDAFHDGELEPDRAEAFRKHVTRCARCEAGLLDLMQETATTSRSP